ncbi:MAG: LysR family transcriptional regulator, partial [Clostridiales bacterium]|nr:LysR family transcriptional regulator [Clostridiales bacterium]
MELLQLRYFCTVVKYGNITKAAEELRISQPSLSKTISNLEKELGVTLFDRIGKHILLNDFGKAFYRRVSTGLNSIDDGLLELADMSNVQTGHVNLLILAASNLMPELFISFHSRYPHIKLHLKHPSRHELILSGDCDLCISATPE